MNQQQGFSKLFTMHNLQNGCRQAKINYITTRKKNRSRNQNILNIRQMVLFSSDLSRQSATPSQNHDRGMQAPLPQCASCELHPENA